MVSEYTSNIAHIWYQNLMLALYLLAYCFIGPVSTSCNIGLLRKEGSGIIEGKTDIGYQDENFFVCLFNITTPPKWPHIHNHTAIYLNFTQANSYYGSSIYTEISMTATIDT